MISKCSKVLLSVFALGVTAQAAFASDYCGIYPGLEETALARQLINQGDGFYKGILGEAFVRVLCLSGEAGVIDIIYDYDGKNSPPPPQLRRFITLGQAVKLHSLGIDRIRPTFGLALDRDKNIYGVVDTSNNISYTLNGPPNASTQCMQVSYLRPDAPLMQVARSSVLDPNLGASLLENSQEIKIFNEDGTNEQSAKSNQVVPPRNQFPSRPAKVLPKVMPTRMADCFSVQLLNKKLEKFGVTERLVLLLCLKNKTPKDIRGVKGTVIFVDMFGDKIQSLNLKVDDTLSAGDSREEEYGFEFNKYIQAHRNLLTADLEDITVQWKPEIIIFIDGTTVKKAASPMPANAK